MATRYDDYMNRRSWMVDTAETPKNKKNLPNDLNKLDKAVNWASRSPRTTAGTTTGTPAAKNVNKLYRQGK
jgi:hypothetical protein